MEGKIISFYN